MPVDDLSDVYAEIRDLKEQVRILMSANPLEAASIRNGRVRFIGGLLRVDEGGRVEIVGTLMIDGETIVSGTFKVTGPWELEGDGTIAGDVIGTGKLTWNGLWEMIGAGQIRGDVEVLDNGNIRIGQMIIDPTEGGSITFPGGTKVQADPAGGARIIHGTNRAYVGPSLVSLQYGADKSIALTNSGITVKGAKELPAVPTGGRWMMLDGGDQISVIDPGTGGPTGGPLMWPFSPNTTTDEFGPRDPGDTGSPFHNGLDFAVPTGSPIPAAASGTVVFAGGNATDGYGYYVDVDHGGSPIMLTRYAHMNTAPAVSTGQHVNRGDVLGPVGNTGASFGAHLHFEVHIDGVPVNPRSKLPKP